MLVRAKKSADGKYRLTIGGLRSVNYWIEKGYSVHNRLTSIGNFKTIKEALKFIERIIGVSEVCLNCKTGIDKDSISVWEDYATGRLYRVCPYCNGILK